MCSTLLSHNYSTGSLHDDTVLDMDKLVMCYYYNAMSLTQHQHTTYTHARQQGTFVINY